MKVAIYVVLYIFNTLISNGELTSLNKKKLQIDLPRDHLPFLFNSAPELARECKEDEDCPFKEHLNKNVCWGYEDNCDLQPNSYSHPICDEDHKGWVKTKDEQLKTWYKQADFGYIKDVRNSMTLLCQPTYREDSSLECSESMTFCRGRNLMIDLRDLEQRTKPVIYDTDVLKAGQIGGYCKFLESNFKKTLGPVSSLQSWTPELQHFKELPSRPISKNSSYCDRIIKRPTMIMKLDATVSYYHHFCDFVNLYMSLHVNSTSKEYPFGTDVNILIWRTHQYKSNFESAFTAFTSHRLLSLSDFKGKRVCFQNVVFPLLPRMIFGLYYNTPLISGCRNSGLFHAFSNFLLHRLGIERRQYPDRKMIRVTFLSRKTTYRKVLNEDELIEDLEQHPELIVNKAEFTWSTPFTDQLKVMQNTDILIGMHGAGLTHMLFLPEWASVFELYNCDDEHCYKDLARLRGVEYITWENDKKLDAVGKDPSMTNGAHAKHTNYIFDRKEFMRLVEKAIGLVKVEREKFIPSSDRDEL